MLSRTWWCGAVLFLIDEPRAMTATSGPGSLKFAGTGAEVFMLLQNPGH
jgi:hypothetical protein